MYRLVCAECMDVFESDIKTRIFCDGCMKRYYKTNKRKG